MKNKIKNLGQSLEKAKESWIYIWETIEKSLSYRGLSDTSKHYLFQNQVLLDSNKKLLDEYEQIVSGLKEKELTEDRYEYISRVLNNLTADHQAKAISIENILKLKD